MSLQAFLVLCAVMETDILAAVHITHFNYCVCKGMLLNYNFRINFSNNEVSEVFSNSLNTSRLPHVKNSIEAKCMNSALEAVTDLSKS